jgi:hypothetical protein
VLLPAAAGVTMLASNISNKGATPNRVGAAPRHFPTTDQAHESKTSTLVTTCDCQSFPAFPAKQKQRVSLTA